MAVSSPEKNKPPAYKVMSSVALLRMPDMSSIPEFMRVRLTVHIRISYLGSQTDGEKLLAPMRAAAPTLLDTRSLKYPSRSSGTSPLALPRLISTVEQLALLREPSPTTVAVHFEVGGPEAGTPINLFDIRNLRVALNRRQAAPDNATGALDAAFLLFTSTIVPPVRAISKGDRATPLAANLDRQSSGCRSHPGKLPSARSRRGCAPVTGCRRSTPLGTAA
jgi:hypothetical protein